MIEYSAEICASVCDKLLSASWARSRSGGSRACQSGRALLPAWWRTRRALLTASALEVDVVGCCEGEPAVLMHVLWLATPEEAVAG